MVPLLAFGEVLTSPFISTASLSAMRTRLRHLHCGGGEAVKEEFGMKIGMNLAVAAILVTSVSGVMVACGGGGESPGSESNSGGKGGNGAGGASASNGDGSAANASDGQDIVLIDVPKDQSDTDKAVTDAVDECGYSLVEAEFTPASMLFVIDRSGSMGCNPPPTTLSAACEEMPRQENFAQLTKWEITREALGFAWEGFLSMDPLPYVGVTFFPKDRYCAITDSDPDVLVKQFTANHYHALDGALNAVITQGYTPIVGSMMRAYKYLHTHNELPGNRFVVLLTDGAESCDDPIKPYKEDFLWKVSDANSVGIKTFVLGVPGSEGERRFLSTIAYNGGTASDPNCVYWSNSAGPSDGDCHMDMTLDGMNFASELNKNLEAINSQALSCEFETPAEDGNFDPDKVNVVYSPGDGSAPPDVYRDKETPCSSPEHGGWNYNEDGSMIILCGTICEKVKADPKAKVQIMLGCPTIDEPDAGPIL